MSMVIQQKIVVSNIKNPYFIRVFYDIILDSMTNKLSYNLYFNKLLNLKLLFY